jgi:hypothetical protein
VRVLREYSPMQPNQHDDLEINIDLQLMVIIARKVLPLDFI